MSKVRIVHEDVFIGKTYHYNNIVVKDPIPEKYHFYYNVRWISNLSNIKSISIRKIKVFPSKLVSVISIEFIDYTMHSQKINIVYSLANNNSIFDILDNFCNESNRLVNAEHPNFGLAMKYKYNMSMIEITSNFPQSLQYSFILVVDDTLRIFNDTEDPLDLNI
jgi:hypothetical protein